MSDGTSVAVMLVMRHLLVLVLAAACVDSSGMPEEPEVIVEPEPEPQQPEPEEPKPEDPTLLIAAWQQCMDFGDFQAANMASTWSAMKTANNHACTACHSEASNGFVATPDAQKFFNVLKTNRYMLLVFITLAQTAQGNYEVVVNERTIPEAGSGAVPLHPAYNAAAGMAATRDFYARTQARCASPL